MIMSTWEFQVSFDAKLLKNVIFW